MSASIIRTEISRISSSKPHTGITCDDSISEIALFGDEIPISGAIQKLRSVRKTASKLVGALKVEETNWNSRG